MRLVVAVKARASQTTVIRRKTATAVVASAVVVLVVSYCQLPKPLSGRRPRAETCHRHLLGRLGSPTLERSVR